ncbi:MULTISPECIES: hypothetical protein [unclassified Paenibacillus]|uniref:hypothetical protein n=1 Tax=unclassified Paenibacillus TaxID=185978 RepID=UPI001AE4351D|nr:MULTISPECIES: hypothetical protein [unclassified Paenibacillus]MBP1156870.1 high-affinity Fe2+/Pb2+ permease [Paenibacillus sp. PvP091]MBP1172391.1 high-affinity Fe2+/Pb2+ permease [Paenibacillus sp. PvR098]MBP2438772.1 high-affinity Fe2+/Pb2+ permease [Paenibacillus sp. PvP052]
MLEGYAFRLLCCLTAVMLVAGCGQEQQPANQKTQSSNQQNVKPIDTELRQQMKMYQEIKQQEYKQNEQLRQNEKKQLKKLQKQQEEMLKRELEFQEKVRKGGNPWSDENKEEKSSGKQQNQVQQK